MKINTKTLKGFQEYKIVQIGDIHIGAKNCAIDELRETVKYVKKNDNVYVKLAGDLLDLIVHSDRKRFNPSEVDDKNFSIRDLGDLPNKQAEMLIDELKPIQDKILCAVIGNHEVSIAKYHHNNIYDHYCNALGIADEFRLGDVGIMKYKFSWGGKNSSCRDWVIKHGIGGGGYREGYVLNHVMDLFRKYDCDIHTMGHVHKSIAKSFDYVGINSHCNLAKRRKMYGVSGCYLKALEEGSSTYGDQMKGMLPDIGFLEYTITRSTNKDRDIRETLQEIIF